MSYATYELPVVPDYQVATNTTATDISLGGKIKLIGFDYGHTALSPNEPASDLETRQVPSGSAAWAWLRWQPQETVRNGLKASIYFTDALGHVSGQSDDFILGDRYLWSPIWKPGEAADTYHIISTLPAVPPGRYDVYLAVYDPSTGERFPVLDDGGAPAASAARLGSLAITRSLTVPQVSPEKALSNGAFSGSGLELLGYDLPPQTGAPGEPVPITLYWRAISRSSANYRVRLGLRDSLGKTIAEQSTLLGGEEFPTSMWAPGEVVRDWHDLVIPATASSGDYRLEVDLMAATGTIGQMSLSPFKISARPRTFTVPAITHPNSARVGSSIAFLGYDLRPEPVRASTAVTVTLHWQALAQTDRSYTVFVHLLGSDGQIRAQRDGVPGNGNLPTTGWIPDEFVADSYQLDLTKELPPGSYALEIGMYDAASGARLAVSAVDNVSQANRILLPGAVEITGR